jgi:hypothetical protein
MAQRHVNGTVSVPTKSGATEKARKYSTPFEAWHSVVAANELHMPV